MTLFALTLSHEVRAELLSFVQGFFILFVFVSFVCVAGYTAKQIRAGRFFTSDNAPLPLAIQPRTAWIFVVSGVGLIYLQSPLFAILVLLVAAGALLETGRTVGTQFGFDRVNPIKALTWGLLVFGAVMMVEEPLTKVWAYFLDALPQLVPWLVHQPVPHPEQKAVETLRQYTKLSEIFDFMFGAVLLSPALEELFFRGFLLTFLKNYTSTWLAIVLSAGVFAFAHLNLGAALPLWLLGIVLGAAYEHTGCLLVPFVIHGCFNLATGLYVLMDKGSPS